MKKHQKFQSSGSKLVTGIPQADGDINTGNDGRPADHDNRRREHRVPVQLPAMVNSYPAVIEDINSSGCFVRTNYKVAHHEDVSIVIDNPAGPPVKLTGTMMRSDNKEGFGFLFDKEDVSRVLIEKLIKQAA